MITTFNFRALSNKYINKKLLYFQFTALFSSKSDKTTYLLQWMVSNKNVNRSRQFVSTLHQYEQIKSSSRHKHRNNEVSASSKLAPNTKFLVMIPLLHGSRNIHLIKKRMITAFNFRALPNKCTNKKLLYFQFTALSSSKMTKPHFFYTEW